jgi:hypothetical protein
MRCVSRSVLVITVPDHAACQQHLEDVAHKPVELEVVDALGVPEVRVLVLLALSDPASIAPDEVWPDDHAVPVVLEPCAV